MRNKGQLINRLDALEDQLISPLDRRIAALSDRDRNAYNRWKQERIAWSRQFGPGEAFAAFLNDERGGPQLPRHVARQLFEPQRLRNHASEEDARGMWQRIRDGKQ